MSAPGARMRERVDVERLKQLVAPHALRILETRGMEVVGRRTAAEIQIRNRNAKRLGGRGRGDEHPSASWNSAKGLLVDFGDPNFNGDLIHVVGHCDGISFVDAAKRVAEETGIELPMLQPSGTNRASARVDQTADAHRPVSTDDVKSARDHKIALAQRKWNKAGPLRDSCSESYLAARGITLAQDEPWLRANDTADYWAPPVPPDTEATKIVTMPALVAALTVAGVGEPVAVVRIFFGHSDDGQVTVGPRIEDRNTGRKFTHKPLQGVKSGAGVYVGSHLLVDTIVVTEGLEDALSAVMAKFPAAAMLSTDFANLELPPRVKRVILAADNDGPGAAGFSKAAPIFYARGYEVLALSMPDGIKDLNDLLRARGADDVRRVLDVATRWLPPNDSAKSASEESASTNDKDWAERLIERADDINIGSDSSQYLIKNLLDRRAVALLYGPSAVGKSFVALRLASHIATGTALGTHKVRKAPVLYIALEGEAGFRKRVAALRRLVGEHGNFLFQIRCQPVLNSSGDGDLGEKQVREAARQVQAVAGEPPGLIVIDTLWRCLAGDDENDASALSKLVARLSRIQAEFGAAVMVVHHTGKDVTRGPRGSSAMMPAVDLQIVLETSCGERYLKVEKCKDGPDGAVLPYRLDVVQLGADDEGDPISSCVAEFDFTTPQPKTKARKALSSTSPAGKAREQLRELVSDGKCIIARGEEGVPDGVKIVNLKAWRAACTGKRLTTDDAQSDSERRAFDRACRSLENLEWVARAGDWVWLIEP